MCTSRLSADEKGEKRMTTFTINEENEIVAFATAEEAATATATPFDSFTSQQEFGELAAAWPAERPVAIWNSLTGVTPVQKFKDSKTAVKRIWARIQRLGESVAPKSESPAKSPAQRKVKRGAQAAQSAPARGRSGKKATPAKHAPKGKKAAQGREAGTPRAGTKTAQVLAMLQRKGGATLAEIMEKMGWQRHTVRGFMAGAMKKAGYFIESFKPEGGDRTYRINQ
jgi:hypothetical protein